MAKNIPVITINREYGAGGRSVAKALSEIYNIPWYDKDFIQLTAQKSGFSEEDIKREGEELSNSGRLLDSILNNSVSYTSSHDAIFEAQKKVVLELSKSPCIIVGRCANIILREAGVFSYDVFLYADLDTRIKRAAELKEADIADMKKYVEKRDHLRGIYHKTYTRKELGDYHDYDLMINTGLWDVASCVNVIKQGIDTMKD